MKNFKQEVKPFEQLFAAFKSHGKQLYAVGGCIRDILLDTTPKDFDFCTDATPTEIKEILAANHLKVLPVGEEFGTIATIIHKKSYEITTFRVRESYTRGSRHPVVVFGTSLARDLERRDLTINAMAMDGDGNIVDPLGGEADLEAHILRVPESSYEKSIEIFSDDPLRMLRLARFMGRLGFDVDPDADKAARQCAPLILDVSRERWKAEIEGLLISKNANLGLNWLMSCGILPLILPETLILSSTAAISASLNIDETEPAQTGQSLWEQTLSLVSFVPAETNLRWAALLHFLATPYCLREQNAIGTAQLLQSMSDEILTRFKCSNEQRLYIRLLLTPFPKREIIPDKTTARRMAIQLESALKPWLQFNSSKIHILSDKTKESSENNLQSWNNLFQSFIDDENSIPVKLPDNISQYLQAQFNIRGKILGGVLNALRDAIIDGHIPEGCKPDDCQAFVSQLLGNGN